MVKAEDVLRTIREKNIEMIDVHIIDLPGTWQHVTIPVSEVDEDTFTNGIPFDGSSLRGFRGIEESDMLMIPDPDTAVVDPFATVPTLSLVADVTDPQHVPYQRDPRRIARNAEEYLKASGIADVSYWGPEIEFFIFDSVRYINQGYHAAYQVDSSEGFWNSFAEGSLGHTIRTKEGYFPVPPLDSTAALRTAMVKALQSVGIRVEMHHHEVATAGQGEIDLRFNTLTKQADTVMMYKYVLRNVAQQHGKTVTFMPKPIYGDNGNGMHVHQSLWKDSKPLFYSENGYAHMSPLALSYIAGILKHARAILAFSNPSTNSYRRLVPGFEAPVNIVFSHGNRSAAIRIPVNDRPQASRIEFRTPDSTSNPYLAFAAMLMAGLDGIRQGLDPVKEGFGPLDKNIYALSKAELANIQSVPGSLSESLDALEQDHAFLLEGGVFSEDLIQTWIDYKRVNEVNAVNLRPHPMEFELYFNS
ncbi:type I glutamate--ammonia ligase [Sulfobacillus thermosulfidooxidans]|uniref:Glutamine synthetase n=1 Tax=Sulfobacillus thermosulfidooxidans (strain DSM 9293 / VKM B-1269 / AT-1) TaxID=929705 RepID=A0A1W1W853_SULTA|nr:type I glutamate--ammonia ligase [Sulfobacillus thermosulfidooxidans]OLZ10556.1 type I glutamate--ammonia ligase [Sulfobacillus thermosulfidooxidans]OLZ15244.1 type I glutamate--ammonia ligase [Sulfobacillus thermosulfidooxidans]OLZ22233.1 type I glutamate--ammonia ligase [Sulfobacillus thermosulfidooxidans]SMC02319.1 L-glutamine synthetase [Sulfobacillus thermosulfidooxidans DSM 9293]